MTVDLWREGRGRSVACALSAGKRDRLVPKSTAEQAAALTADMQVRDIAAPHLLFQVAPDECAAAIRDFVGTIEGG